MNYPRFFSGLSLPRLTIQQEYYIGDEENKMATGQYSLNLRTLEQLVIDITSNQWLLLGKNG